jgi:hypothetical protein
MSEEATVRESVLIASDTVSWLPNSTIVPVADSQRPDSPKAILLASPWRCKADPFPFNLSMESFCKELASQVAIAGCKP